MDGCERAALDDAACSFRFGKMPSILAFVAWFFAAPWARLFMVEIRLQQKKKFIVVYIWLFKTGTYSIFTAILTFPAVIHSYFILGITCRPARLFEIVMIFSRKMHMVCISLGLIIPKYIV